MTSNRPFPLRFAPALIVLGLTASAQDPAAPAQAAPPAQTAAEAEALLGAGLTVGDTVLTPMHLKQALVSGSAGRTLLESAKLQVFIDEEIERRTQEAGGDGADIAVTDGEVDAAMAEFNQRVKDEYGDQVKDINELIPMPQDLYRQQVKQTELFDKLFLPESPFDYPPLTVAALNQSDPNFVENLKKGYKERQEAGQPGPDAAGQAMFNMFMRQLVVGALNKSAEVKTFADGLPPEVAMEVNGRRIATEDIWKQIAWKVTEDDVRHVKLWYARTIALRDALEAGNAYMTDAEFDQAWFDHTDPYKDSPFNQEAIAVGFKRFPSAEHYRNHFRLIESYRRMIGQELTDENLQAHVDARAGNLLGLAKVDVEVILLSAYDFKMQRFAEGGWERATERAVEAMKALAQGTPWGEVLDQYSEFYEPPRPSSPQALAQAEQASLRKGRFGLKNRNELLQALSESEWSMFLDGTSLTDTIFFDSEVGIPTQPMKGPHGWYIALVKSRTAPVTRINIQPEGHRNLVEQDYVSTRFNDFAQEQLAALQATGKIQGLDPQ